MRPANQKNLKQVQLLTTPSFKAKPGNLFFATNAFIGRGSRIFFLAHELASSFVSFGPVRFSLHLGFELGTPSHRSLTGVVAWGSVNSQTRLL